MVFLDVFLKELRSNPFPIPGLDHGDHDIVEIAIVPDVHLGSDQIRRVFLHQPHAERKDGTLVRKIVSFTLKSIKLAMGLSNLL